jgi:hypothetical protein
MIVGARDSVDKDMKVEIEADAVVLGFTVDRVSVVACVMPSTMSFIHFIITALLRVVVYNCVDDAREYKYKTGTHAHT